MPTRTVASTLLFGVLCMFSHTLLTTVVFCMALVPPSIVHAAICWIAEWGTIYNLAFCIVAYTFTRVPAGSARVLLYLTVLPGAAAVCTTCYGAGNGCRVGSVCLLYTSPSPRDRQKSRMPSSA